MGFYKNARKPEGWGGKLMLNMMNKGHEAMAKWGFSNIDIKQYKRALDIGCGGGVNIKKMLAENADIYAAGIDYSDVSVQKSKSVNLKAIKAGRCEIKQGDVMALPYDSESFDLVTAFETIYFWPDIEKAFQGICSILENGGRFLICNGANGEIEEHEKWIEMVGDMKIYNSSELEETLKNAGFTEVNIHKHDNGWLCIVAQK